MLTARTHKTLAEQFPYTLIAITPGGHRFAVASYPTWEALQVGSAAHREHFPNDCQEVRPTRTAAKCPTCSLPAGVAVSDAIRGLETGRCYVCGTPLETRS